MKQGKQDFLREYAVNQSKEFYVVIVELIIFKSKVNISLQLSKITQIKLKNQNIQHSKRINHTLS